MGLKVIFLRFLLLIEFLLMLCISLIESTLEFPKAIREVAEDVGATDLHKGLISGLQEYHELFVHVPKQMIAQHQIHPFPVLSDHALLIEVDVVALEICRALSIMS
jgi:hypothetical protein